MGSGKPVINGGPYISTYRAEITQGVTFFLVMPFIGVYTSIYKDIAAIQYLGGFWWWDFESLSCDSQGER